MTTVEIVGLSGRSAGSFELPAEVFDQQANIALMHQVVVGQLAAARQGTHKAKTRGEVSGGGKKPYKQKGTGRARQGSIRAPQFTGGGVVHGPVPRDYSQRTPKKMKAAALRGALSDRAREGLLHVVEGFIVNETPSTKAALAVLRTVTDSDKVLVVLGRDEEISWLSLRNVPTVHLLAADQLNTYDVLVADQTVFTATGLSEFLGVTVEYEPTPEDEIAAGTAVEDTAVEDTAVEDETDEDAEPAAELDDDETDDTDEEAEK